MQIAFAFASSCRLGKFSAQSSRISPSDSFSSSTLTPRAQPAFLPNKIAHRRQRFSIPPERIAGEGFYSAVS
jgi:hypothetical protein